MSPLQGLISRKVKKRRECIVFKMGDFGTNAIYDDGKTY